jgi:hypothetical protein
MKWQNLIRRECPACERRLQPIKDKVILYECDCGFSITRRKLGQIIADPSHVLRRFLTAEEAKKIKEICQN